MFSTKEERERMSYQKNPFRWVKTGDRRIIWWKNTKKTSSMTAVSCFIAIKFPKESTRWSQWSQCEVPVERYCMSSQHSDALNQCRSLLITSSTWSPSEEIRAYLLKRSNPAGRVYVCQLCTLCRKWNFLNETFDRGVVPPVWSG